MALMDPPQDPYPPEPAAAIFSEGDVVAGRYRILRFIAQGGMGEVYAAEDAELRESIALKVLRPEAARDSLSYERFRREIQAARRIVHPNVARIFDIERHVDAATGRSLAFLTMELLPGDTLAERLEKGPLPLAEALPIIRQVAAALSAAHRAGVVHRDLKPGNVILVPDGAGVRAVVTDFNLASLRSDDGGSHGSRLTQADLVVGTACYMAPEQAQGLDLTGQADLYAFGVVIFEMVTGRLPHEAESAVSLLLKRLQERPPEPKAFAPDLPDSWNAAILRCLAIRPEDRFASAEELVAALQADTPVAVPEFRAPGAPSRRLQRAAVALAVVALFAMLFVAVTRGGRRGGGKPIQGVQLTASLGLDLFPSFAPSGDAVVYASDRSGRFEIWRRALGPTGAETPLTNDGKENVEPVVAPDGATVVYHSRERGGLWTVSAAGGAPRLLNAFGSRPSFSPDGTLVVFQSDPLRDLSPNASALPPSTIWTVTRTGGPPRQLTMAGRPEGGHGAPVFSPDGRRIVFLAADSRNSELWQMNADGSGLTRLVAGISLLRDPVFSPDGRSLFLAATPEGSNPSLLRVRLGADGNPEGHPETLASFPLGKIRHLAVSRDGHHLAYAILAVASNIWTVDVDPATGTRSGAIRRLTAETGRMSRPDFSPDGLRIAFSRYRSGASDDLFLVNADGTGLTQVTSSPSLDSWPSWFADGKRLAFLSDREGHAAYWSHTLSDGAERRLFDPGMDFDAPRLSHDGTRVAWNSRRGGRLNVWVAEIASGPKGARQLTFDAELMGWPCWSPDGRLLAVQARRGTDTQLALVPAEGGAPEMLVTEPGQTWASSFSPDGDRIAFAGERGGLWNVYSVSRSTRSVTKLTDFAKSTSYVRYPTWSPRGNRIAFEYAETAGNIWLIELPR